MLKQTYNIPTLPLRVDLETVPVLKALARANRALAELKGQAPTIPNQGILIDMLSLQEAKSSSEVENIVTTHDELYQAELFPETSASPAAKEVARYSAALKLGYESLKARGGVIANRSVVEMFQLLKNRNDGFRTGPGTALKDDRTGDIVYVPPQDGAAVQAHMAALERYVNEDDLCALDPLIKMALIHHQFESIHPFPDGNGRIGRILNVLYLTRTGLLDTPVLYLSRHITRTKGDYYRLLQRVRDEQGSTQAWEAWVLYVLDGVAQTAQSTVGLVTALRAQMARMKHRLRTELPQLYSQDLLNNLFRHPYTRIDFVVRDLGVTRQTAAKYLDRLAERGLLHKHQSGRNNYYINAELVALFQETAVAKPPI